MRVLLCARQSHPDTGDKIHAWSLLKPESRQPDISERRWDTHVPRVEGTLTWFEKAGVGTGLTGYVCFGGRGRVALHGQIVQRRLCGVLLILNNSIVA